MTIVAAAAGAVEDHPRDHAGDDSVICVDGGAGCSEDGVGGFAMCTSTRRSVGDSNLYMSRRSVTVTVTG